MFLGHFRSRVKQRAQDVTRPRYRRRRVVLFILGLDWRRRSDCLLHRCSPRSCGRKLQYGANPRAVIRSAPSSDSSGVGSRGIREQSRLVYCRAHEITVARRLISLRGDVALVLKRQPRSHSGRDVVVVDRTSCVRTSSCSSHLQRVRRIRSLVML